MKSKSIIVLTLMWFFFSSPMRGAGSHSAVDVPSLMVAADFVFKGMVVNVQYKNSELTPLFDDYGNPIYDANGNPVYADGSDIPHAFVTYTVEQVYKVIIKKLFCKENTLRIIFIRRDDAFGRIDQNILHLLCANHTGHYFRPNNGQVSTTSSLAASIDVDLTGDLNDERFVNFKDSRGLPKIG